MIHSYWKIMRRNMARYKVYTFINLLGLTMGITSALIIFLYVYDELTYDHNHTNHANIYRLNGGWNSMSDASSSMYAGVGYIVGEKLKSDFAEIDQVVRLRPFGSRIEKPGTDEYFMETIFAADSNVFQMFSFPLLAGNPKTALTDNRSLIISRKMAQKYFNKLDVVGETLRWFGQDTLDMKISAVMENYPDNTHIKADFIILLTEPDNVDREWFQYRHHTYFTLRSGANIKGVEDRIMYFTKPYVAEYEKRIGFTQKHSIIPFSKIHLHSDLVMELENHSKASHIYIFLIIGIFILVLACINYMNLATARSLKRAKEIGVRKVVGALRHQLVKQFFGEAFLTTLLAALVAAGLVFQLLPLVNEFTGKQLDILSNPVFWLTWGGTILLVTLMAGSYPSFFLSSFKPAETLKGGHKTDHNNVFRKGLVVFQFTISVASIAGTLIIMNHLNFLRTKDLGFEKDHVIVLQGANKDTKNQLLNTAGISKVSSSNRVPGFGIGGSTIINGWDERDQQVVIGKLAVDHDFIDLYNFQMVTGRTFNRDIPTDQTEAFLINETAMTTLGITNPENAIGHELWLREWGDRKGKIIGVLKDFHFRGVNATIEPFMMFLHDGVNNQLSVKVSSSNFQDAISKIEQVFQATVPGRPFEYNFLDETFDRQYRAEERFMTVFSIMAIIGIIIGCLGLYGLAMFMAEQRTKEVGIRKVLGASEQKLVILLTSHFLKLVAISFGIAIPLVYYGMEQWIGTFPYREKIDPLVFVITGLAVFVLTIITVSHQALRAALSKPSITLRAE
jgi:putative ABC transport system permease protein